MKVTRFLKSSLLFVTLLLSSLIGVRTAAPVTDPDQFPRLDDIYFTISYPETTTIDRARAGELDTLMGMINPDNVDELRDDYSWSVSSNPGFHMCYWGINCRDHPPELAPDEPYIPGAPYGIRNSSFELYPLNVSQFRYALHLLAGDKKDDWLSFFFRFINGRVDTVIPPANTFWYNTDIPSVPYDPEEAYRILTEDLGWSNASGYWIDNHGQELRPIYVVSIHVSTPIQTLTDWLVASWNVFFGLASNVVGYHEGTTDEGYYFHNYHAPFYDIFDWVFLNRDFDIYELCWGLNRDPDYLYDYFHPDNDYYDGFNTPGLTTLDGHLEAWLYALKHWVFPEGYVDPVYGDRIESLSEMRQLCNDIQCKLYYQTPYIPKYSRNYINAYTPGLAGWVDLPGYGSDNFWTLMWLHWPDNPAKTSVNYHLAGPVSKLHPATSSSSYEQQVLAAIMDMGIRVGCWKSLDDVLWTVRNYTWSRFVDTTPYGEPVDGCVATLTLRSGITWHDGQAADAYDVRFCWEALDEHEPQQGEAVWQTYVNSTVTSPTSITVWYNSTDLWSLYSYTNTMFLLPPQIYSVFTSDTAGFTAFQPWLTDYTTHTGNPKPAERPWLTCLIGVGPYVFVNWDTVAHQIHVTANRAYWARNFTLCDINLDGHVDISDITLCIADFGATAGHLRWSWGRSDINRDGCVDIADIAKTIKKFGVVSLPP